MEFDGIRSFKPVEFDGFKIQAGKLETYRKQFDLFLFSIPF